MATAQEKAQCASWFIETKSDLQTRRNFRTISIEEIHRYVHQFVQGARNLYRQGQCSIKGPRTAEKNIDRVRNRVPS